MAVYNSSVGLHQDDSDITIINPSIIHETHDEYVDNTYVPIITRLKQANNSSENRQISNSNSNNNNNNNGEHIDGKHDYIFVDHNPQKMAKDLEDILMFYIRDLKQENNTQLDCDRQLVGRLMDLIRPAYPHDQQKMIALDKVTEEIAALHDKRYIEQKEKIEQLKNERHHLNQLLLAAKNEQLIYNNTSKNYSMQNTMHQTHSLGDYDQWTEIEDDAKKLHEIVQSQKNQINEIVTLISETATATNSLNPTYTSINHAENTEINTPLTPPPAAPTIMSTLLKKIQDITGQKTPQEPVPVSPSQETILENHSPGVSPSQSLATLTLESFQPKTQQYDEPQNPQTIEPEPIREQPHVPIDIPITNNSPTEPKKCPVCNHEFSLTSDDVAMYDHIEKCLFPTGMATEPKEYECPNCNRKYPGNDEGTYLQHLTDCYNRDI